MGGSINSGVGAELAGILSPFQLIMEKEQFAKEADTKIKAYYLIGYAGITFSVICLLSMCITLPVVYNYVNQLKGQAQDEFRTCEETVFTVQSSLGDLRDKVQSGAFNRTRIARDAYSEGIEGSGESVYTSGASAGVDSYDSCSGCCLPGPAGPKGPRGNDGRPGRPEDHPRPLASQPPHHHAQTAQPDQLDPQELRKTIYNKSRINSRREPTVPQECQAATDHLDHLDHPKQRELLNQADQDSQPQERTARTEHPGSPGERGICPKYCAIDGGIFFEDGTRR
ncbi:hypothetical protein WR25_00778 [Diploscapter pachys]|uniref:Nematode cuticle collagen N-terminal domain-containing protein n=1 Tax=Diploscapter pachys TaxID=2018661 RepID=A0A2A2KIA0_9BILA|nr:hypothetical protein WR25_00778 [Diploscapter pachys]